MAPSTTFGASVVSTDQEHFRDGTLHRPMLALDSPDLTPVPSRNGELLPGSPYLDKPPPNSPFYQHPPASFERVSHSQATSKVNLSLLEKDLEHGGTATPLSTFDENPFASKISVDQNKECQMWPSKQTLLLSQAAEKKQKRDRKGCVGCGVVRDRWAGWSKREQLIAKLVLAGLIVGVIVAVAVGISVAVHGTVYSNSGSQSSVGHSNSQGQQ